jgi:hypothetical protein
MKRSQDYLILQERMINRVIAQDVMMNLDYVGSWVKDSEFRFLDISERTAEILYGKDSNYCIGKTDYHIAQDCGLEMSEDQFAEVCRASDNYVQGEKPVTFIELLSDTKGEKHIWKTIKSIKVIDGVKYYYGFAVFLDFIVGGYERAFEFLKQPNLKKINDNLYVETIDKK